MIGEQPLATALRPSHKLTSARVSSTTLMLVISIAVSTLLALVMVKTDGSIFACVALLSLLTVVAVTFYRLDWGFYVFVFFVFLFDQWIEYDLQSVTSQVGYFLNLNAIAWLPKIDQGVVTPMELQLLLIFAVWVFVAAVKRGFSVAAIPLKVVTFGFAFSLAGWIAFGLSRGGDFIIAMWETRALFYLVIMFLFLPQIVHTREQLQMLIWIFITGISIKAVQGAIRFAQNGFSFGWWPHIYNTFTNHEDPVFMITLFLLLMGLSIFHAHPKQRNALLLLLFPLFLGFVAAQRRATYASFMASIVVFITLLPSKERRRTLRIVAVVALVFGGYLAAFWNVNSRLGSVAQQFKATVTQEGGVRGSKDIESTEYREAENYNLGFTFRNTPLTGVGFGMPFQQPLRMWGVQSLALGKYVPHNQILWIFVKMGLIGGFIFWFFFNCYVFRATVIYKHLKDPYLKVVCIICIIQVINQFVVSYVDMQLTYYRNMTYLGALMAIVTVLEPLDREQQEAAPAEDEEQERPYIV